MRPVLYACFAVSGAAALALELLWLRSASLLLGATAPTTALVLACYFAGLATGSLLGRRPAARPVRRYALLELGVAAGVVWSVALFHVLAGDGVAPWLAGGRGLVALLAATLPATVCLGATLPSVAQALATAPTVGRRGAVLYAVNTLGGAVGLAAAGFGLPAAIGVRASYAATAAASALAGAVALAVAPRARQVVAAVAASPARVRLRVVAGAAGALALGLEVLWTRLFAQVLHNSVYSFTALALVFLLAIAGGAGAAAVLLRRRPAASVAAGALVAAALGTVVGFRVFLAATDGLAYVGMRTGLAEYVARIVALAAATAGPTALASGVVLPALWAAWGERHNPGRPLGDLTAANAVGAALGSVAAGFVVVPTIGARGGLLLATVAYLVLADALAPARGPLRPLAWATLLAAVLATPLGAPLTHLRGPAETLRATLEGPGGTVTVVEGDGDLQLRLDNYYVLGGSAAAANERRMGLLPLLLHPAPRRVAFIGLATGITASAAPALGVAETTVVELVPEVAAAARAHFASWNGDLLERPGVRLVVDDGRRWLATTPARFDVVVSDLFIPWHAGAGSLYAREMYETVARRLAPGGLFCQWLPLYQLTREEFDTIARTFLAVFPAAGVWRDDFYPDRPVVGLVGQRDARPLDLTRVAERLAALPDWARDPLLASPRGLLMLHAGNLAGAADLLGTAPLNTDDRPRIEFLAPRLTRIGPAGDKDWFTGEALAAFYDALDARLASAPDPLVPATDDAAGARRAGTAMLRFALATARHDDAAAARLEAEVRAAVPDVILAAASGDADPLPAAQRTLHDLSAAQDAMRRRLESMEQQLGALGGTTP
jgi:spermidine synthase